MTDGVECGGDVQADEGSQPLVVSSFVEAIHLKEQSCFGGVTAAVC